MKSATTSLEMSLHGALRSLGLDVPVVSMMEVAAEGVLKEQGLTSVQVRVFGLEQTTEALPMFTVSAEIRLNVEQAESANGQLFFDTHEKVALWLERVMVGNRCDELETDEVFVDGFRRTGGEKDFDPAGGVWFAVWNVTICGRFKGLEATLRGTVPHGALT